MEEVPFKSRPKRLEETNPQRGESRRVCGRDKGLLSEPEGTDGVTAMADGRRGDMVCSQPGSIMGKQEMEVPCLGLVTGHRRSRQSKMNMEAEATGRADGRVWDEGSRKEAKC